jgi:hypothetical protein
MLVGAVAVQVTAEINVGTIKLLERLGHPHGETDDLIRHQLSFERRTGFRPVVNDAGGITPVEGIRRTVIARIGVVKYRDQRSAFERAGPCHSGDVGEKLVFDGLEGPLGNLTSILPAGPGGVRKVIDRLGNDFTPFYGYGLRFDHGNAQSRKT